MDLIVLVVLAVIITVTVVVVQRKQPRTPFNTPGQFTRAAHPSAYPSDAVQRWIALHDYAAAHHLRLLYVQKVYERHPKKGCKARVSIYGEPGSTWRDAWFWHHQVQPGSVVAVAASQGWGSHSRRDDVLFIGSQDRAGVHATLDAATVRRAQRQHRRPPPPLHPPQR